MRNQGFQDGLYVMRQVSRDKGVFHYAIMDVGNRLQLSSVPLNAEPVMLHKPPTGLRCEHLSQTTGVWTSVGEVADETMARARLMEALKTPHYDLFGSNCEQFVNFVAYGNASSTQLFVGGLLAFGLIAAVAANRRKAA